MMWTLVMNYDELWWNYIWCEIMMNYGENMSTLDILHQTVQLSRMKMHETQVGQIGLNIWTSQVTIGHQGPVFPSCSASRPWRSANDLKKSALEIIWNRLNPREVFGIFRYTWGRSVLIETSWSSWNGAITKTDLKCVKVPPCVSKSICSAHSCSSLGTLWRVANIDIFEGCCTCKMSTDSHRFTNLFFPL